MVLQFTIEVLGLTGLTTIELQEQLGTFMGSELPFEGCMDEDAKIMNREHCFQMVQGSIMLKDVYDPDAKNYNSEAEVDDGSCEYYVEGCMDPYAKNYNSKQK